MAIEFTVYGVPQAQKRHRHFSRGKFVKTYDPSSVDKNDFLSVAMFNMPDKPIENPINIMINFYFPRPKSHFGTGRNSGKLKDNAPIFHTKKPDIDNLIKFVLDSLNKRFWKDDSYIFAVTASKRYGNNNPRTKIEVNEYGQ